MKVSLHLVNAPPSDDLDHVGPMLPSRSTMEPPDWRECTYILWERSPGASPTFIHAVWRVCVRSTLGHYTTGGQRVWCRGGYLVGHPLHGGFYVGENAADGTRVGVFEESMYDVITSH